MDKESKDRVEKSSVQKEISEQLQRDTEKALLVQKQMRKDAPKGIQVGSTYKDPREILARRLVPEAFWQGPPTSEIGQGRKGTVPPTKSLYFDRPSKHRENIAKGYVPVIHEGEQVQQAGDLLYERPIEFQKQGISLADAKSVDRLREMDPEAKADGILETETKNTFIVGDKPE